MEDVSRLRLHANQSLQGTKRPGKSWKMANSKKAEKSKSKVYKNGGDSGMVSKKNAVSDTVATKKNKLLASGVGTAEETVVKNDIVARKN